MAQGSVVIDRERCKGCALCVGVCPKELLRIENGYNGRGYHPVMLVDNAGQCAGCALCALLAARPVLPPAVVESALERYLPERHRNLLGANRAAFRAGMAGERAQSRMAA